MIQTLTGKQKITASYSGQPWRFLFWWTDFKEK